MFARSASSALRVQLRAAARSCSDRRRPSRSTAWRSTAGRGSPAVQVIREHAVHVRGGDEARDGQAQAPRDDAGGQVAEVARRAPRRPPRRRPLPRDREVAGDVVEACGSSRPMLMEFADERRSAARSRVEERLLHQALAVVEGARHAHGGDVAAERRHLRFLERRDLAAPDRARPRARAGRRGSPARRRCPVSPEVATRIVARSPRSLEQVAEEAREEPRAEVLEGQRRAVEQLEHEAAGFAPRRSGTGKSSASRASRSMTPRRTRLRAARAPGARRDRRTAAPRHAPASRCERRDRRRQVEAAVGREAAQQRLARTMHGRRRRRVLSRHHDAVHTTCSAVACSRGPRTRRSRDGGVRGTRRASPRRRAAGCDVAVGEREHATARARDRAAERPGRARRVLHAGKPGISRARSGSTSRSSMLRPSRSRSFRKSAGHERAEIAAGWRRPARARKGRPPSSARAAAVGRDGGSAGERPPHEGRRHREVDDVERIVAADEDEAAEQARGDVVGVRGPRRRAFSRRARCASSSVARAGGRAARSPPWRRPRCSPPSCPGRWPAASACERGAGRPACRRGHGGRGMARCESTDCAATPATFSVGFVVSSPPSPVTSAISTPSPSTHSAATTSPGLPRARPSTSKPGPRLLALAGAKTRTEEDIDPHRAMSGPMLSRQTGRSGTTIGIDEHARRTAIMRTRILLALTALTVRRSRQPKHRRRRRSRPRRPCRQRHEPGTAARRAQTTGASAGGDGLSPLDGDRGDRPCGRPPRRAGRGHRPGRPRGHDRARRHRELQTLRAGTYRLRFESPDFVTFEREVTVKAGPLVEVEVTLSRASEKPAPAPPPPSPVPAAPSEAPAVAPNPSAAVELLALPDWIRKPDWPERSAARNRRRASARARRRASCRFATQSRTACEATPTRCSM